MGMNDINSLSHTKWNCKYHIVFAPKYRRKVFYREKRTANGKNTAATMRMERRKDYRGRSMPGSYTPFHGDTAENVGIELHGLPQGEE